MSKRPKRFLAVPLLVVPGIVVAAYAGYRLWPMVASSQRNCARVGPEDGNERSWATALERRGLPNLHRVTDDLYRGAQPTADGMRRLREMGVRTIVNLRSFHSDRDEIGDSGLAYEHIYMKVWHPEDEEAVRFLQIVTDKARTPAFVHCKLGSDRTGLMCALYRVAVGGWSKAEAVEEMTEGGFGYNKAFGNLVGYLRRLDIDEIRRRAGLAP